MKNILVIMAHPDDEVLGCGGSIAKLSSENNNVFVVFMTNGVSSRLLPETKKLVVDRKAAALEVKKILGIEEMYFGDLPDNEMDNVSLLSVVKKIEDFVREIRPTIVFTHSAADLNVDHYITHRAVMTACRPVEGQTVKQILSCEVLSSTEWSPQSWPMKFQPNYFVDISSFEQKKMLALNAYSEELRPFPHPRSVEGVMALCQFRGASVGFHAAEAFQVERIID